MTEREEWRRTVARLNSAAEWDRVVAKLDDAAEWSRAVAHLRDGTGSVAASRTFGPGVHSMLVDGKQVRWSGPGRPRVVHDALMARAPAAGYSDYTSSTTVRVRAVQQAVAAVYRRNSDTVRDPEQLRRCQRAENAAAALLGHLPGLAGPVVASTR